jgi:hypothetical protein
LHNPEIIQQNGILLHVHQGRTTLTQKSVAWLHYDGFLLCLLFSPEEGGDMFHQNIR